MVNPQARPLLIYVALEEDEVASHGQQPRLTPLSPWAEAAPPSEQPTPLSLSDDVAAADAAGGQPLRGHVARGANCLLLAPYEGTERCVADEGETAPFGASNTFRYAAATGELARCCPSSSGRPEVRLRVEAAFQLITSDGEEMGAEAPFVVASLPLPT